MTKNGRRSERKRLKEPRRGFDCQVDLPSVPLVQVRLVPRPKIRKMVDRVARLEQSIGIHDLNQFTPC